MSSLPPAPVPPHGTSLSVQTGVSSSGSVTVNAKGIPAGDILVVAVETTGSGGTQYSLSSGSLTAAPAPACVSLPAASAPPGSPGSDGAGSKGVTKSARSGPGTSANS